MWVQLSRESYCIQNMSEISIHETSQIVSICSHSMSETASITDEIKIETVYGQNVMQDS
jgi:hypothetical protein